MPSAEASRRNLERAKRLRSPGESSKIRQRIEDWALTSSRDRKPRTQRELAHELGVSQMYVWKVAKFALKRRLESLRAGLGVRPPVFRAGGSQFGLSGAEQSRETGSYGLPRGKHSIHGSLRTYREWKEPGSRRGRRRGRGPVLLRFPVPN